MLNKIIRYFKGVLRIRISGHSLERFINTCSYKGIPIWEISNQNSFYEMNITIKDFKKMKPVIRKTRTKVTIVKRTGFPFFIHKYQHRKLFISGFFLCVFLILYLSTFIWHIKIEGNVSNSTENLKRFLASFDIIPGTKNKEINCLDISRKIRDNYDDIIWVSTSLNGSELVIKIKENTSLDQNFNISKHVEPYDIIASETCQITDIIIRKGISKFQTGDYIKKGDILVSGQIPIYNDDKEITNYQYCISDADIYGQKNISYEDIISTKTYDKNYLSNGKQEYYLKYENYRLMLGGITNEYIYFEEMSKEYSVGKFTIGVRKVCPYEKNIKLYTEEQLQKLLSSNFQYYCNELKKKGVVILKNNVKIYTWSDKAMAKGTMTVKMPIGQKIKSEIIETGDYIDGNDGNNY